jgi:hypothetical protein
MIMDTENFMERLSFEMNELEIKIKGEAFLKYVLSGGEDVCISNLACGIINADSRPM